eukprot:4988384-Pyramimonas_sp.AAC.1
MAALEIDQGATPASLAVIGRETLARRRAKRMRRGGIRREGTGWKWREDISPLLLAPLFSREGAGEDGALPLRLLASVASV